MSFKSATCPSCGANIEIDEDNAVGTCEACGQKFITKNAINNFSSKVQNINIENATINMDEAHQPLSQQAVEDLKRRAESAFTNGEFQRAYMLCKRYSERNPKDFYGWFGCARAATKDFRKRYNLRIVERCMKKAKEVATDKELKFIKENSYGYDDIAFIRKQSKLQIVFNVLKAVIPAVILVLGVMLICKGLNTYNEAKDAYELLSLKDRFFVTMPTIANAKFIFGILITVLDIFASCIIIGVTATAGYSITHSQNYEFYNTMEEFSDGTSGMMMNNRPYRRRRGRVVRDYDDYDDRYSNRPRNW